jgi:hypothetical protein
MSKNLKGRKGIADLPKRERMLNPEGWGRKSGTYHKVDGIWPWQRVRRLCQANIGRSFDRVFSEYCHQVPDYQQEYFLEEFEAGRRWWRFNEFYKDDQGRIQKNKRKTPDKRVTFYSDDYKTEYVHKETGAKLDSWAWRYDHEEYHYIIVRGWSKMFSSKNDPEFKRLSEDQRKRRAARKRGKDKEKEDNLRSLSFETKAEKKAKEEEKKERETDESKIERKGFGE